MPAHILIYAFAVCFSIINPHLCTESKNQRIVCVCAVCAYRNGTRVRVLQSYWHINMYAGVRDAPTNWLVRAIMIV